MSFLFGSPKAPSIPPPAPITPPPSVDAAAQAQTQEDQILKRKGRAATLLSGQLGSGQPTTATKTLLGS